MEGECSQKSTISAIIMLYLSGAAVILMIIVLFVEYNLLLDNEDIVKPVYEKYSDEEARIFLSNTY